jgi:hypothetical protein
MMRASMLCGCALVALVACGGAQLNQTRVTDVQAAVLAAEQVGATQEPKASLHLQLAKEEVQEAKRLAADGDEVNSNLLLDRAKLDAQLALQLARTEREQQSARQAWEKIRDLKQDAPR